MECFCSYYSLGIENWFMSPEFLTRDPVWPFLEDPQKLNPYPYAAGNPLLYVDPAGTEGWDPTVKYIQTGRDSYTIKGRETSGKLKGPPADPTQPPSPAGQTPDQLPSSVANKTSRFGPYSYHASENERGVAGTASEVGVDTPVGGFGWEYCGLADQNSKTAAGVIGIKTPVGEILVGGANTPGGTNHRAEVILPGDVRAGGTFTA